MMGRFLQNLFRIFLVLLLATIGAGSSGAAPSNWSQTEFSILQPSILTGNTDPTNPLALSGKNIGATGGLITDSGNFRALSGAKVLSASLSFLHSSNAPNKVATQADVSKHFTQNRKFWSSDPVQINGNKVYQRNDLIDVNKVDPKSGKTNLELMQSGRAPLGPDGKAVNLHHLTQKQDGAIAEVTQTLHSKNHGILHMPNTVPSGINRSEFNTWRSNYWKNRANDF